MIPKLFLKNNKNIIKKILLFKIFKKIRRNINNINTLYIKGNSRFGNYFISLNNAIIYCEFLGCKKIIINNSNSIYIKKKIFYKKRNITIEPNQVYNPRENNSIVFNVYFFYFNYFNKYLKNINRFGIFKKQLLNNLPKVITHPNDLYIYFRSGDIFQQFAKSINNYYQPPLCFYKKILLNFKFRKVFIVSEDKLNPVIPLLLTQYSSIKLMKNNLKVDISYLINAFNIVAGKSTFFAISIKFNDKLKFLWEYNCLFLWQKYLHFHHSVIKFPFYFTIYSMNSSANYRKLMHTWTNSPNQRKMMIEEKCLNNFDTIRPRLV